MDVSLTYYSDHSAMYINIRISYIPKTKLNTKKSSNYED